MGGCAGIVASSCFRLFPDLPYILPQPLKDIPDCSKAHPGKALRQTTLRLYFNGLSLLNPEFVVKKVKSLGIKAISFWVDLSWERIPEYVEIMASEFENINATPFHDPSFKNEPGWEDGLRRDAEKTIKALARLGINNYPWMIECNLYDYWWNGQFEDFVNRNQLARQFNTFYEIAHSANPDANVLIVPYPCVQMNHDSGKNGWKDWWVNYGEKMKFDQVALDAHVGVWIWARTNQALYDKIIDPVCFLKKRGHQVQYIEVGYPTCRGMKPRVGGYGWGREQDQVELLETCYQAVIDMGVPWMQICEFTDPVAKREYDYASLGNDQGEIAKFLGILPVREERHFGLLKPDGTEKKACNWVRKITKAK